MSTWGLIGFTGTVGQVLKDTMSFDYFYNSDNIGNIVRDNVDTVVCAAPTGNRLWVANNVQADLDNINLLTNILKQTRIKKFILISTVDTLSATSGYGVNRKLLEDTIKDIFDDHHIIRLPTLISKNIKKNVLFDLKNNMYLSSINPESKIQWCLLDKMSQDISNVINSDIKEVNLVSEPIKNKEIIDLFFADKKGQIGITPTACQTYNITPVSYTKDTIFENIREYLK
jgi:hypothetical protein